MPHKAIIFDMDGVLVDSEPVIEKAAILFFKEIGITALPEDFKPFIGAGEDRYIGGVCEKYKVEYNVSMKKRVYEIYLDIVDKNIKLYDEIIPCLNKLKEEGFVLAVGSSADKIKIEANLKAANINKQIFDAILGGEDVENKKPSPDIYLKTAERLNINPKDCIVVEDAVNGIMAGKNAGMKCIGLTTSFGPKKLLDAGADTVCSHIKLYECIKHISEEQ